MALTLSNMLVLGTKHAELTWLNVANGRVESFNDHRGEQGTRIAFICDHWPYYRPIRAFC